MTKSDTHAKLELLPYQREFIDAASQPVAMSASPRHSIQSSDPQAAVEAIHAIANGFAHLQPWTPETLAARAPSGVTAIVDSDPDVEPSVSFSNAAGDTLVVTEYVNESTSGWGWERDGDSGELETEAELDELLAGLDHDVTAGRRCSIGHSGTRRLSAYSSREKRFVCDGCSTYYSRATVIAGASTFPSAHPGVTRSL